MFGNFDLHAKRIVGLSRKEAQKRNHSYIGTEHILLGVLSEDNAGRRLLQRFTHPQLIRQEIELLLDPDEKFRRDQTAEFTPFAQDVWCLAAEAAQTSRDEHVRPEHITVALSRLESGNAALILAAYGVTYVQLKGAVGSRQRMLVKTP